MPVTSTDIVNQALQYMGGNVPPVTGSAPGFDSSAAGKAASYLYTPCVQTVGRQFGWDFSRNTVVLVATGNTPPAPYTHEYLYPTMGVQVRQVRPTTLPDQNDPLPVNWAVANTLVGIEVKKVIQTRQDAALAVFTNQPTEDIWDALFREEVVRLLASEFAMALAGKPETSRDSLEAAVDFGKLGESRDS